MKIGTENNILKGNLLKKEVKDFLINNPNAFLLGLISDQSVKAEIAWSLPYHLKERIGTFDFQKIVHLYDETKLSKQNGCLFIIGDKRYFREIQWKR